MRANFCAFDTFKTKSEIVYFRNYFVSVFTSATLEIVSTSKWASLNWHVPQQIGAQWVGRAYSCLLNAAATSRAVLPPLPLHFPRLGYPTERCLTVGTCQRQRLAGWWRAHSIVRRMPLQCAPCSSAAASAPIHFPRRGIQLSGA